MLALEGSGLGEGAQLVIAELQADGLAYIFGYEVCVGLFFIQALFSFAQPSAQIDCIREDRVRSPDQRVVQVFPMDAWIFFIFRAFFFTAVVAGVADWSAEAVFAGSEGLPQARMISSSDRVVRRAETRSMASFRSLVLMVPA